MKNHAVVIGGSMAGLLTASILSEHFTSVTIIERDEFPAEAEFRKGVPQGRHFHLLLAKGVQIMPDLFPGFDEDLIRAGASTFESGSEGRWLMSAGWLPVVNVGIDLFGCSRNLLEWLVRQRLMKLQNITFIEQCDVTELLADPTKTTVTGVRIHARKSGADVPGELTADLVVDTSGRGSHLPEWLEALGYDKPQETRINSFLGYATRTFKRLDNLKADWKGIFLFPEPPKLPRGGALFPVEGDR
jgi:2-polyprenyl-6-methoxyphenol hydroxylase-like FAD-dependent oxidoreductase